MVMNGFKVSVITLVAAIGTIAAVSWFLRQAVIDNNIMGTGRKLRKSIADIILQGKLYKGSYKVKI